MSLALCASCWVSSLQYDALAVAGAHAPSGVFFWVPVQPDMSLRCALGLFWFLPSTYQRCNADLSSGELHFSSVGVMRVESWYLDHRHVQDLCPFASM